MSHSPERDAGRHAVVIGSGIAGLVAARVLTEHFERVTVLERDRPSSGARPGVPQARHAHLLLVGGGEALERLFPGLGDEMAEAGAPLGDFGADAITIYPAGMLPRRPTGLSVRFASRTLREALIRRRVEREPRITIREGVAVKGLIGEGHGVAGVRIRARTDEGGGVEEELRADLVVAACGREAPVVEWLGEIGYPAPEEDVVDAFLSYSTRWFRTDPSARDWRMAVELPSAPDRPRGGGAFACEDGKWVVTLVGIAKERTPTDEAGFDQWTASLQLPHIRDLVREAEPISPIYGSARTENRRRHFESVARFPDRFVVLGDAVASFNPMYGQGMTVAALGALELDACIKEQRARLGGPSLVGLSRRFQQRLARTTGPMWQMATGEDFRWPETEGKRPGFTAKLFHGYFDRLLEAATEDPLVHETLLRVQHVVTPATALFKPAIASRVLGRAARPVLASAREAAGALGRFAL